MDGVETWIAFGGQGLVPNSPQPPWSGGVGVGSGASVVWGLCLGVGFVLCVKGKCAGCLGGDAAQVEGCGIKTAEGTQHCGGKGLADVRRQ